jgi:metal-responsive CopG/Arc/MetJ family transcriptional regulator
MSSKASKPKSTEQFPERFTIAMDKLMLQELTQIAQHEERSIGHLIRKAIEKFIEEYKPKQK